MTAAELIEELKKYPPETPVYFTNEDCDRAFVMDMEDIEIKTLPLGWSVNAKEVTGIML